MIVKLAHFQFVGMKTKNIWNHHLDRCLNPHSPDGSQPSYSPTILEKNGVSRDRPCLSLWLMKILRFQIAPHLVEKWNIKSLVTKSCTTLDGAKTRCKSWK